MERNVKLVRGHRVRFRSDPYDPPPPRLPLTYGRAAVLAIAYGMSIVAAVHVDYVTGGDGLAMTACICVLGFCIAWLAMRWTRSPWRDRR